MTINTAQPPTHKSRLPRALRFIAIACICLVILGIPAAIVLTKLIRPAPERISGMAPLPSPLLNIGSFPVFGPLNDSPQGPVDIRVYTTDSYKMQAELRGESLMCVVARRQDGDALDSNEAVALLVRMTQQLYWEPRDPQTQVPTSGNGFVVSLIAGSLVVRRDGYQPRLVSELPQTPSTSATASDDVVPEGDSLR